jgi:type I restriction enzyme S subunit
MKRYPTYKDSGIEWIGQIPKHWDAKRLKFALSTLESGNRQTGGGNQLADGVFSVGGEHVGWFGEIFTEGKKFISEDYYAGMTKGKIKEEDVLLVKDGATIGKCAFVHAVPDGKASVNEHVFLMRANSNFDGCYIFYFIWSYVGQEQIKLQVRGSAQPGLNSLFQNYLLIPDLPLKEQQIIAEFLDRKTAQIDDLIAKKERMIELLKEERTAVINQAVTRGLDPNVELKDSGIEWLGKIPKHWILKKIKYVSRVNTMALTETTNENYEFNYIDISNVGLEEGLNIGEKISFLNAPSRARRIVKKGDTIVSTVRTYLKAIVHIGEDVKDVIVSTGFAVVSPHKNIIPKFLYYVLRSEKFIDRVCALSVGVSYPAINSTELSDIVIWYPDNKKEQGKIVDYLDGVVMKTKTVIKRVQAEIEYLKEYRTSLISEVVTGKIDVRN